MKFLLTTLLIIFLAFIAGLYLPWWSIAIVAFAATLLMQPKIGLGFLAGFVGIFLLWAAIAFWIDTTNNSLLSHKIAQVIPLGGSTLILIMITALVGGLVGGFAAMAGASIRFRK
ncbi:MAG TPA: hypothetical protein VM010_04735 [Chitinophagaceae bacterium]|nr:hypothetical protein [Chitinophagaceae bacterium]